MGTLNTYKFIIVKVTTWIQKHSNYIYNLLTDKGIIINQLYIFTDYNELCSTMPETTDESDDILLNYLNDKSECNVKSECKTISYIHC